MEVLDPEIARRQDLEFVLLVGRDELVVGQRPAHVGLLVAVRGLAAACEVSEGRRERGRRQLLASLAGRLGRRLLLLLERGLVGVRAAKEEHVVLLHLDQVVSPHVDPKWLCSD